MNFIIRNKIPLLLFLLGLLLYANTIDSQRLMSWDDNRYLEENFLVRNFEVGKIFTDVYFGSYIPVTLFSFAVEHHFWGLDPAGYHVVNMFIHALNGVLVFFFLFLLTGHRPAAIIGAVLFIVHPVQVESVAWISQRKNLLSMFFFLWAFISHIRSRQSDTKGWLWAAWAFYLLSVLSKPAAVGAPILFMAYDYFLARLTLRRTLLGSLVPLCFAAFGAAAILVTSAKVGGIKEFWGGSRWAATQLTFLVTWENISALIWPSSLSPHYIYADKVIYANWRVWAGLAILLAFTGLSLRSLVRFFRDNTYQPMTLFFYLWIMAFMLPVSNIVPIAIQRSDRHLYFPSVMIFLMIGLGWFWLWQRYSDENRRRAMVGAIAVVAVLLANVTYAQNQIWTDSGTLWRHHLKNFPEDDIAVNNLAMYYFRTKQYPEAIKTYDRLLEMAPKSFRPHLFLGLIAFDQFRFDDAIRHLRRALPLADQQLGQSIRHKLLESYAGALSEIEKHGQPKQALDYYYEIAEVIPNSSAIHKEMGDTFRKMGDLDKAETEYKRAMSLSEKYYPAAHAGLGNVLLDRGLLDEARAVFEEGLGKAPNSLAATGMCKVLAAQGESEKALEGCYLAAVLSPNETTYADQAADMLLRYYTPDDAYAHASKHLEQFSDLQHLVCGHIYAKAGEYEKAIENYSKFASIPLLDNVGKSAMAMGDYAQADAAYERILGFNKNLTEGIGGRCMALTQMGDLDKADDFCRTAIEQSPQNGDYQEAYADLLAARERTQEAIEHYQRALNAGSPTVAPKLSASYTILAQQATKDGLSRDAIGYYRKAIALNPKDKESLNALGSIYMRQRRFTEAQAAFEAAVGLDAEFALALANKGFAAHALGKNETARASFERALTIDSELPQALVGYCVFLRDTGGDADAVCRKAQAKADKMPLL